MLLLLRNLRCPYRKLSYLPGASMKLTWLMIVPSVTMGGFSSTLTMSLSSTLYRTLWSWTPLLSPLTSGKLHFSTDFFNQSSLQVLSWIPLLFPPPPTFLLDKLEITVHDVFVGLSHLSSKKSVGIDGISSVVWKSCATALCEPVHHLFTLCFSQSYIPPEWKIHCVTPIFKSGDKVSVKNYRPISLLCIISKVFERIVFDKIYDHIASFIICSEQYGFLRKRSTIQQLLVISTL